MANEIVKAATFTPEEMQTLVGGGIIPANAPAAQVSLFFMQCQAHGLNPFTREIYLVNYGDRWASIVGINGLRAKAARTGALAGIDDPKYNLKSNGAFQTAAELNGKTPESCTVTVWKMVGGVRCPFTKTVLFKEFYPRPTQKAATMPVNMIEKVAQAHALRMAFSAEVADLHIEEEEAAFTDTTIKAAEVRPGIPELAPVNADELEKRIADCKTLEELRDIYNEHPGHQEYVNIFTERRAEIEEAIQTEA